MRSQFADYFNHDNDAPGYDADVQNERDPIRTGYAALMAYVGSCVAPRSRVLDLGTGTGNTILHLPGDSEVTGVDVSGNMLQIAESKLRGRRVQLIQDDVLHYVTEQDLDAFDAIVSTYTLHHLTPQFCDTSDQDLGGSRACGLPKGNRRALPAVSYDAGGRSVLRRRLRVSQPAGYLDQASRV